MATYTEKDLQEMIWRANTPEKQELAYVWIESHSMDPYMKECLLNLAQIRPNLDNHDYHVFDLMKTVVKFQQKARGART